MRKAAERLFQAVLGNQEQRSSAEQEDIERAANREPWVHEVCAAQGACSYCGCYDTGLQTTPVAAWQVQAFSWMHACMSRMLQALPFPLSLYVAATCVSTTAWGDSACVWCSHTKFQGVLKSGSCDYVCRASSGFWVLCMRLHMLEGTVQKCANAECIFECSTSGVLQGFLKAYDSVRSRVLGVAGEVLGEDAGAWHVYVTGHSLGGALATLCSYELANRRWGQSSVGWLPALTSFEWTKDACVLVLVSVWVVKATSG